MMLDISDVCGFADYFVICSADSGRQMDAICQDIDKELTGEGATLLHREGTIDSGWVLLDFGDVIIHVFSPLQREYYQLDQMWEKATPVVRIQ